MPRKKKTDVVENAKPVKSIKAKVKTEKSRNLPVLSDAAAVVAPRVFEYKRLSASMMKLWLQCKRKFHLHYIDRMEEPPSISFTLGLAVHSALEAANHSMVANPRKFNPFEIEEFLQIFRDSVAKAFAGDLSTFIVGEEIVKTEVSNMSPKEKIIGIEQEFDLVTEEGVRIYGFIDKIEEVDSNTIKIIDYKTSNMSISWEEARIDPQLALYDLACSVLFPQYQNRLMELRYVKLGESVVITKSDIERHNFKLQLVAVDKAIKEYVANYNKLLDKPKGQLNAFCHWCSFRGGCSQYVDSITYNLPDFPTTSELDDGKFLEMWIKMSNVKKATEEIVKDLKVWAVERIKSNNDTITDGKSEIWTLTTTRREYDPVAVAKAVGFEALLGAETNGKPLFSISNAALQDYLKATESKRVKKKIEAATVIKFNNPQIRTRKTKTND